MPFPMKGHLFITYFIMPSALSKSLYISSFVSILLVVIIIYYPATGGDFAFDDTSNILKNESIKINNLDAEELKKALYSGHSGILKRPISMLSFALNYYATDFDPFYFKLTNIIIHLFNGIGIFILINLILLAYRKNIAPELPIKHIQLISLLVTSAWLFHPLNLTSVLYIVQRMTSLAALFSIFGLILYLYGRIRINEGKSGIPYIVTSILIFLPLSILSKENGALLPVYMLVIEYTLFNFTKNEKFIRIFLILFFSLLVTIPAVVIFTYLIIHPEWLLDRYTMRDFNLTERVMTEARVLWFYIQLTLLPDPVKLGIYHDDFMISRSLFQPISTIFSLLGIAILLIVAFVTRRKLPLLSFGIFFFLVGHSMESTILPLELIHEHRNYLPIFGLLTSSIYYLLYPFSHRKSLKLRKVMVIIIITLLGLITASRADYWGNLFEHAQVEAQHHPDSPRANFQAGRMYAALTRKDKSNRILYYNRSKQYFERATYLDKNYTAGLFGLIILANSNGISIEHDWLIELNIRLRSAPFASVSAASIHSLVNCNKNDACNLDNEIILDIIRSSLQNSTIRSSNKAAILASASDYLANHMQQYHEAVTLAHQAVMALPDELQYRMNLIDILIAIGDYESAIKQIAISKKLDKFGAFEVAIEAYESKLPSK